MTANMTKRIKKYTLTLIGIIIAGLIIWQANLVQQATSHEKNGMDSFMVGVQAYEYSSNGSLEKELIAHSSKHYSKKDYSTFSHPNIKIMRQNKAPWHITAENGILTNNNTILTLLHHVVVKSYNSNKQLSTLLTSSLIYNTKTSIAHTKDPVTIIKPDSITKAVGMQVDLNSGNSKLLSQIHTTYTSNKHP